MLAHEFLGLILLLAVKRVAPRPQALFAKIEDYWELKDKGGPLGKINLRVFFDIHEKNIIILGVHKKEDEGQLRKSVKVRISRRKRLYFKGMEAN